MGVHFDLCQDSGAPQAFFPNGRGAMTGVYEEVHCKDNWVGSMSGQQLWNGACVADENVGLWPTGHGCGNQGSPP